MRQHKHKCGACPETWECSDTQCGKLRLRLCASCKEREKRRLQGPSEIERISRAQTMHFVGGLNAIIAGRSVLDAYHSGSPVRGTAFEDALRMRDCSVCNQPPGCCDHTHKERRIARERRQRAQYNEDTIDLRKQKSAE